jgi:hypothetical protein
MCCVLADLDLLHFCSSLPPIPSWPLLLVVLFSFSLDLPAYTLEDALYSKLLFAVQNCVEIDGDQEHMSQVHRGATMTREEEESEEWQFR